MFSSKNFFITRSAGGYLVIEQFLASGSWKCPAGVTAGDYVVVAGGGGGGTSAGISGLSAGGGSGGFRTCL